MITSLRLVNFKNFADETLRVGPFTVLVGANASGKSNIRDAFRFLHGIGRGYTLAEIIGGKYGPGGQREWESIRGAPNEVVRLDPSDFSLIQPIDSYPFRSFFESEFSLHVELKLEEVKAYYSIRIGFDPKSPDGFRLLEETLKTDHSLIYGTEEDRLLGLRIFTEKNGEPDELFIEPSRSQPVLTQISEGQGLDRLIHLVDDVIFNLSKMRFIEPLPDRMREPSFPGATNLGDSGENLPTVLENICTFSTRKQILADWLRELTPMDIDDFEFPRDPSGRIHLMLCEANDSKVSAYSASDGTLRLLALLAAILGKDDIGKGNRGFYFFEDIDNGIHPARQSLVLDLIEKQVEKGNIQVLTTTHAPGLLTAMNDVSFENASVVCRHKETNDAVIRPVSKLPNARDLRRSQGLGRLLTGGWMEDMLAFSEGDKEDEEDDS